MNYEAKNNNKNNNIYFSFSVRRLHKSRGLDHTLFSMHTKDGDKSEEKKLLSRVLNGKTTHKIKKKTYAKRRRVSAKTEYEIIFCIGRRNSVNFGDIARPPISFICYLFIAIDLNRPSSSFYYHSFSLVPVCMRRGCCCCCCCRWCC